MKIANKDPGKFHFYISLVKSVVRIAAGIVLFIRLAICSSRSIRHCGGTMNKVNETVATLKGIPTKSDLKGLLEQNVIVVDFTKLDGDKRIMTCTLREDMKPRATKVDPMSTKKVREISDAVVSVWDVKAEGWRSFRYDRINSVDVIDEYMAAWYTEVRDGKKVVDKSVE
jgi:uncharacterized protein YoxC